MSPEHNAVAPPWAAADTATAISQRELFARVMFLVAVTCGFAAAGAYIGRDFGAMGMIVSFVGAIGLMLIGRRMLGAGTGAGMGILFGIGLLLGMGAGPLLSMYASAQPMVVVQAAGATGLFVAAFGAWGYATRRDLALLGRIAFFALLALIVFGIVMIFVSIPGGALIYSVLGLVIFAALIMFDFQRLRRAQVEQAAVVIALSIFLDVWNVFLFMLQIIGGNR